MTQLARQIAGFYKHAQTVPASTWVVTHALYNYPIIDVFVTVDGVEQKIIPASVEHISNTTAHITFTSPMVGYALVV